MIVVGLGSPSLKAAEFLLVGGGFVPSSSESKFMTAPERVLVFNETIKDEKPFPGLNLLHFAKPDYSVFEWNKVLKEGLWHDYLSTTHLFNLGKLWRVWKLVVGVNDLHAGRKTDDFGGRPSLIVGSDGSYSRASAVFTRWSKLATGPTHERFADIHPCPLTGHYGSDSLAQLPALIGEDESLNESDKSQNASQANYPPIGRRFVIMLSFGLLGFFLCFWGWQYLDKKRKHLGATLIGCGALLNALGLGLWWLTGIESTWGWFI